MSDNDFGFVDEDENLFPGMFFSDPHMVESACPPEGELSCFVDFVVPDSPVIGD